MIRVFVIDDVPLVGRAARQCLRDAAIVDLFTEGEEALEALRAGAVPDVILCDMFLGETDGADFERALDAEFPALSARLCFMSGGAVDQKSATFLSSPDRVVVEKPFGPASLLEAFTRVRARGS